MISLIYLATQVRQNTRSAQVSSKITAGQKNDDFSDMLLREPGLHALLVKGRMHAETMDADEYRRFALLCQRGFWSLSCQHKLLSAGVLVPADWKESEVLVLWWLRGKGVRFWWENGGRNAANGDFAAYIDSEITKRIPPTEQKSEQQASNIPQQRHQIGHKTSGIAAVNHAMIIGER